DMEENPLVHIVLSSGSTGRPKAVPVSRRVLLARIQEHVRDFGLSTESRFITSFPMSNGPCYWATLATLAAGGTVLLANTAQQLLLFVDLLSATHLTCSPPALADLLKSTDKVPRSLSSLRRLDVAGSLLPSHVAQLAQERFTPNLFITYGST